MNKLVQALLFFVFPVMALAADPTNNITNHTMSFTPPVSDLSVVFLGNLFGIVDGVLHGNGSQIMGAIFSVFNSAVLALGGMVIMYTLLVSTMNTAQEGQMLGQKWSSIWIPVRSVAGLALLMPKASGYCLMQIFVMWVVVQGVGAADKIWNATLSYLNRGGAIVQAQIDPTKALMGTTGGAEIATGAQTILAGEVCMVALQHQLNAQLEQYKKQASSNAGPCSGPSTEMKDFCNSSVPDFLSSVDVVAQQENVTPIHAMGPVTPPTYQVKMPNFPDSSIYSKLNGICGTIHWNDFSSSLYPVNANLSMNMISDEEYKTAAMSRAIAIQQMYSDFMPLAQVMVGNDPSFSDQSGASSTTNFSMVAKQGYGYPLHSTTAACLFTSPDCILWGNPGSTSTSAALLAGNEFQNATADYDGIMLPSLTLISEALSSAITDTSRNFIAKASSDGWIMAGSYFFDLVDLNTKANKQGDLIDANSGLGGSTMMPDDLTNPFSVGNVKTCNLSDPHSILCSWMNKDRTLIDPIKMLINGAGLPGVPAAGVTEPVLGKDLALIVAPASSTVYGYTNNATILRLPNQPGQTEPVVQIIKFQVKVQPSPLFWMDFPCGEVCPFSCFCLGSTVGDLLWNEITVPIVNMLMPLVVAWVNMALDLFITTPMKGMATIFQQGMAIITKTGANPIVALANMGTYYINFTMTLIFNTMATSITISIIPVIGPLVMAIATMAMPLMMAWLGIMAAIGFSTAYYVPILPYMMFTFGAIAWLITVIEAMVAGPIVALGVTHPEGHDAFGKAEPAVMILMNVFLRPSMMIIGYIMAIALASVSVWLINQGFTHALSFMQDTNTFGGPTWDSQTYPAQGSVSGIDSDPTHIEGGYGKGTWAGMYSFFFSVLVYTTMYLAVVTKAFTLIAVLPDKVLRWIGGQNESTGSEAAQMGDEVKKQVDTGGKETQAGAAGSAKKLQGAAGEVMNLGGGESKSGGSADASGGDDDDKGGAAKSE